MSEEKSLQSRIMIVFITHLHNKGSAALVNKDCVRGDVAYMQLRAIGMTEIDFFVL